jgi:Root hair defective 3 GTP-binding protein (RHD3)
MGFYLSRLLLQRGLLYLETPQQSPPSYLDHPPDSLPQADEPSSIGTLLNRLFGTTLYAVDETRRKETGKGTTARDLKRFKFSLTCSSSEYSLSLARNTVLTTHFHILLMLPVVRYGWWHAQTAPLLAMNVERRDGRQRGEDQVFEKESAHSILVGA